MKNHHGIIACFLLTYLCFACKPQEKTLNEIIDQQLGFASEQYLRMFDQTRDSISLPRTFEKGKFIMANADWWTSGFVPGTFWYLFGNNMDTTFRKAAEIYTSRLKGEEFNTTTHDLGFMLFCSYGNGFKLTGDTAYRRVLITGARSLITRFRPKVGCIQSWGSNAKWQCPVIIDNMMNLELLMWAFHETGDSLFYKVAVTHANTTLKNHFRKDFSSYHVVNYDTITGNVISRQTAQGAADESAWARGQAWGLYGYTMMFRETHDSVYLTQAMHIGDFILHHNNLPSDKIPYWDFNAPNIPQEPRDASAAAVICSALIELSQYVNNDLSDEYLRMARQQIISLASPQYCAEQNQNGNFILKHATGNKPAGSEIDVPLTYADYYYVEALTRMKELLSRNSKSVK